MSTLGASRTRVDSRELEKTDTAKEGIVCAIIVLTLAGVLTALGLYLSFWPSHKDGGDSASTVNAKDERLCQGSHCTGAVETLKAIMKADEDPCHDFYRFVCGNYRHPSGQMLAQMEDAMYESLASVLKRATFKSSGQSASEKAAALYDACSRVRTGDVDDNAALTQFMKDAGLTATSYSSANAADKMVMLFFHYNLASILELSLVDTRLHRGKRVLRLALSPAYLTWFGKRGEAASGFYPRHLGPFGLSPMSPEAKNTATSVIDAENVAMEELLLQSNQGDQHGELIHSARDLNRLAPCTSQDSWEDLMSKYSGNVYGAEDEVLVKQPDVTRFARLCKRLGKERLSLLTAWELLRTLMPLSSPNMAVQYTAESSRDMCLRAVARAMEVPLLSWYLFKEVPQATVAAATSMADHIRHSVLDEIDSSTWLDGGTRKTAINKVHSMRMHVGYPSYFGSGKEIDSVYASYPDVRGSFVKPWQEAMKLTVQWMTKNHSSFWYSVGSINAMYLHMRNRIVIPASVLRMPMFSTAAPKAFTYGGLGGAVGHELTHAVDPIGSRWDAHGRQRDWWSASSRDMYSKRLGCLRKSHGTEKSEADAENMADFAGLMSSYNTYVNLGGKETLKELDYDSEQLFFISSCVKWCAKAGAGHPQRYAPWSERCNVPLKNMEEFGEAFDCPVGSRMRPVERCVFW
ncbi:endothelin-converting enzyme 1-like [Amblyomma americanum]